MINSMAPLVRGNHFKVHSFAKLIATFSLVIQRNDLEYGGAKKKLSNVPLWVLLEKSNLSMRFNKDILIDASTRSIESSYSDFSYSETQTKVTLYTFDKHGRGRTEYVFV